MQLVHCATLRQVKLRKVRQIVETLDQNGDGFMSTSEVRVLVSKISGVAIGTISDNHPEVNA